MYIYILYIYILYIYLLYLCSKCIHTLDLPPTQDSLKTDTRMTAKENHL